MQKHEVNEAIEQRRREEWEDYYLKGKTYRQIAEERGLTPKLIYTDVKKVTEWLREQFVESVTVELVRSSHVAQKCHIVREAFAEWEKSKDREVKKRKVKGKAQKLGKDGKPVKGAKPEPEEVEQTTEWKLGDPRYLDMALKALRGIEELIPGALAPREILASIDKPLFDQGSMKRILQAEGGMSHLVGIDRLLSTTAGGSGDNGGNGRGRAKDPADGAGGAGDAGESGEVADSPPPGDS